MKKFVFLISMTAAMPGLLAVPVAAQEPPEFGLERPVTIENARIQLARRVHEFRPIAAQVQDALEFIAADLQPQERALFQISVMENIDMEGLENNSVLAMAQIYTTDELQAMIDYFSRPEADAIEQKSRFYRQRIDPQIVGAINAALDQVRRDLEAQGPMAQR